MASAKSTESMVVKESPPETPLKRRRSRWQEIFDEGRANKGDWLRVLIPLKRSTVAQVASDIRNSHKRDPEVRMRGINDNERWDATWGEVGDEYFVWIRFLG